MLLFSASASAHLGHICIGLDKGRKPIGVLPDWCKCKCQGPIFISLTYMMAMNVLFKNTFPALLYNRHRDSRDRLVVRTLRCGRSNPGSNPGHGSVLRCYGSGDFPF